MSSLTALFVKNSHILARIYFVFLKKNVADQIWKSFNTKFGPQWKDRESSYRLRQISALFCILIVLIVGLNSFKGLRVTKIVKQIKFEGIWGKLKAKNCLQRQPLTKYVRQTLAFMGNSLIREKFNLFFSVAFC